MTIMTIIIPTKLLAFLAAHHNYYLLIVINVKIFNVSFVASLGLAF